MIELNNYDEIATVEAEASLEAIEDKDVETLTTEILVYKAQAGACIWEIGRRLIEVKDQLPHGEWLPYLRDKVDFSEATAQRLMRIAKEYSNPSPVTDLGMKKALQLLAFSDVERDEFIAQKHTVNGEEKTVEEMTSRELDEAIKALRASEEAREEAESALEEMTLEARRTQDDLLEQIEELTGRHDEELERARRDVKAAEDKLAEAIKTRDSFKSALEAADSAAKNRPANPEELKAAREKEAKKLKADIEKAEAAVKKANEDKAKAEAAAAAQKAAYEQASAIAEQERKSLQEDMDALRRKLAVASSSEMAIFKVHFEAAQEQANKMLDCIDRAQGADPDMAAKMRKAAKACFDAVIGSLEA